MEKKNYATPEMEIVHLAAIDTITTSGETEIDVVLSRIDPV